MGGGDTGCDGPVTEGSGPSPRGRGRHEPAGVGIVRPGTIPAWAGETQAFVFSADDGCDVGEDTGAPVSQDYGSRGNAFNGRVKGVQLAIADAAENSDHLVSPDEAIRIAMARQ